MKNTNEPYYMKNPPVSNKNDMTDKLDNSTKNLSKVIEQTKFVISNNLDLDFSKLSLIDNKKKVDLNMVDPKTPEIKTICESLIGSKINIGFTITLQNGENHSGEINNCNIIGNCMEDILYPFIHKHIPTFEKGPKQSSPDFYNSKIWEWELKCFNKTPNFDIGNFNSYISSLENNLEKKMYKTQYLIFEYNLKNKIITIINFKLCNVWELINYTGKNPISLQCKKGMWYNIRPCSFNDINSNKTPIMFVKKICEAIDKTPNKMEDKQKTIDNIYKQFYKLQFNNIIQSLNNLQL
tara:strand:+ start:723 stop:1607 length:885 start_codon:yes stop_codon:yes gene_type:complete